MDEAWQRSALLYVAQAHTPTMLVHGENDPDVPIAEAEQYFIALKDVGVETIFVRYPREGHGVPRNKARHRFTRSQYPVVRRPFPETRCRASD